MLSKAMERRERVQVPVGGAGADGDEDYSRKTGDVAMADDEDIDVRRTIVSVIHSCGHRPNHSLFNSVGSLRHAPIEALEG